MLFNESINQLMNKEWEYEYLNDIKLYECLICNNILEDPVQHSPCRKMFCRKCIIQFDKCPLCKNNIQRSELLPVPLIVTDSIDSLRVKCKKCNKEMNFNESKTHKNSCKFDCPFKCGCKVTLDTLKDHAPLKCNKCECKCPYAEFRCAWTGHGGTEYQNHLQICEFAKLVPLYKMITDKMEEMKKEVRQEIDTMKHEMKQEINTMKHEMIHATSEINGIKREIDEKMEDMKCKIDEKNQDMKCKIDEKMEDMKCKMDEKM